MKLNAGYMKSILRARFLKRASLKLFMGAIAILMFSTAKPAHAQLDEGTGVFNFDIGLNYVTIPTDPYGGISGPGSLTAGIAIPSQLTATSGVFSFMARPNDIYQNATDLNKALADIFPKKDVVDIIAYNKVVKAYDSLQDNLLKALEGTDALPTTTPQEILRKQVAIETIDALIGELEKIAPRLGALGPLVAAKI